VAAQGGINAALGECGNSAVAAAVTVIGRGRRGRSMLLWLWLSNIFDA
jgi:hypothetical protein